MFKSVCKPYQGEAETAFHAAHGVECTSVMRNLSKLFCINKKGHFRGPFVCMFIPDYRFHNVWN